MPSLTERLEADRRAALTMLASAITATMAGCSRPDEEIIPYANMPEGLIAGEPRRFATTLSLSGYGRGVLAISVDGRPIKIEGNPRHPASLGATDIFAEAEVLALYDPDRAIVVRHKDQIATWNDFAGAWSRAVGAKPNVRIGLVTGRILSPTALARISALRRKFPNATWYRYEPVNDDAGRAGTQLAFGRYVTTLPSLDHADVVLALDADPLGHGPDQIRYARNYAARRGSNARQQIFVAEPIWTLTGAAADVRLALLPASIREIGRSIANRLGASLGEARLSDEERAFAERAGLALAASSGRCMVLVGEAQPAELHALAHWINQRLRAPIVHIPALDPHLQDHGTTLTTLADDLHGQRIDVLMIADANPVYDAPDNLRMHEAIAAAPFSAHLGLHHDETADACAWRLPLSHVLESWGDARAPEGTPSLIQPLIRRLYDTRTRDETMDVLLGGSASGYDLTREAWRGHASGDFETWWRQSLYEGCIANDVAQLTSLTAILGDLPFADHSAGHDLILGPDPSVWDGRFGTVAWLQECPKPFTKQVWGNGVQISPADASRLNLGDEDTVDLIVAGKILSLPVVITEGQADGVITTTWGLGRTRAGRIGTGIGVRTCGMAPWPFARTLRAVTLQRSNATLPFHSTQAHTRLSGPTEQLFQIGRAKDIGDHAETETSPPSLLPIPPRGEYAWAMVIDTDSCIGCNACVVACQAENNVPVVGPVEISRGRDMHWLRIDAYEQKDKGRPRYGFQPVPCMQCELAPCEPVCPVEASVHDHQGLNVQVYNRCIGTRFCEANCPYKVRRFNWFAYAAAQAFADQGPALRAQHNPDVSVRNRGVMEKCNYCLQRINRARRGAEQQDRDIGPGEMVTACQAACPARAIHFGNLNRDTSDVAQLRKTKRHYVLLEELNTRPRTTYLKRIYNDGDVGG